MTILDCMRINLCYKNSFQYFMMSLARENRFQYRKIACFAC